MLFERLTASIVPGGTENTGCVARHDSPFDRSDSEIVEKAKTAANGTRFTALWEGSTAGYQTKSESDFALVLLLLYWTDDDS